MLEELLKVSDLKYKDYRESLDKIEEYLNSSNIYYKDILVKCIQFDKEGLVLELRSVNGERLWSYNDYVHTSLYDEDISIK